MSEFKHLSVDKVGVLLAQKDITVVDIRDAHSFEAGHLHNAQCVDGQNIQNFIQQTDKNKPLICYCYHGISSQNAAAYFVEQGFQEVYSMEGGYEAWKQYHG